MSIKTEKAKQLFSDGYNCAQSVSAVFAEDYGIKPDNIMKISCGFGGGMRNAEVCGAVTGAIMVIGMKYGTGVGFSAEARAECYRKTKEFTEAFEQKNNSIICRDLLGIDIFKGDGMARAQEKNLFNTTCVDMIVDAVELLEKMGC